MDNETELPKVMDGLIKLAPLLPRSVATRVESSLAHFAKSQALFETDREMASFRAICGQEEAATAIISSLHHRKYTDASKLNGKNHQHKWAVLGCMLALAKPLGPMLAEFQLQMDFQKGRIDLKIPLSNFGVEGGETTAIQPVEPLDLLHSKPGKPGDYAFEDELAHLADGANFHDIKEMVSAMANARNKLLYASDTDLPKSEMTQAAFFNRRSHGIAMLVVAVMILQSNKKLATIRQALPAALSVIGKLPTRPTL